MNKTRYQKYRERGAAKPNHRTKANIKGFCKKCDRTYRTISDGKQHHDKTGHKVHRRKFYPGERVKNLRGERNGMAKLNETQVKRMRKLHALVGVPTYEMGRMFKCSQQNAHLVVTRKSWKHL